MSADHSEPIDAVPPKRTFLDDVEVYDAELGIVPAWKSLIWNGAKLRQAFENSTSSTALARATADDAGGASNTTPLDETGPTPLGAPPMPGAQVDGPEEAPVADEDGGDVDKLAEVLAAIERAEERLSKLESAQRRRRVLDAEIAQQEAQQQEDDDGDQA